MSRVIRREVFMRIFWFFGGLVFGFTAVSVSFASVPKTQEIVNDGVAYRGALSEIRVRKSKMPTFKRDLKRLAKKESRYQERLPDRLYRPMKRLSKMKYSRSKSRGFVAKRKSKR